MAVAQGLERLVVVSALCFFNAISHLLVLDPTSSVLEDARQRYTKAFPDRDRFHGLQFCDTLNVINGLSWIPAGPTGGPVLPVDYL